MERTKREVSESRSPVNSEGNMLQVAKHYLAIIITKMVPQTAGEIFFLKAIGDRMEICYNRCTK